MTETTTDTDDDVVARIYEQMIAAGGVDAVDALTTLSGGEFDDGEDGELLKALRGKAVVDARKIKAITEALTWAEMDEKGLVERHEDGSATVTLTTPIVWNEGSKKRERTYSKLRIHRPVGAHYLAAADVSGLANEYAVIAEAAGVPRNLFNSMDGYDCNVVLVVGRMLQGNPRRNSSTPSSTPAAKS